MFYPTYYKGSNSCDREIVQNMSPDDMSQMFYYLTPYFKGNNSRDQEIGQYMSGGDSSLITGSIWLAFYATPPKKWRGIMLYPLKF